MRTRRLPDRFVALELGSGLCNLHGLCEHRFGALDYGSAVVVRRAEVLYLLGMSASNASGPFHCCATTRENCPQSTSHRPAHSHRRYFLLNN